MSADQRDTRSLDSSEDAHSIRSPRLTRRFPILAFGAVVVAILMALFPDFLAPHDPLAIDLPGRLQPPVWHAEGTWTYLLGTDATGRDILSRVIYGSRISLSVGFLGLVTGAVIGTVVGLVAGYSGGVVDAVLSRLIDVAAGIPGLLLALLLATTIGPGFLVILFAIVAVLWARFARVVRGEAISLRRRDFVLMAQVAGSSGARIVFRHILPNIINTILVIGSLQLGWTILVEAALSFLGAGIPPPAPAWGSMTAAGRNLLVSAYWVPLVPAAAIVVTVFAFNLVGDWLRDRLDPKLTQL